MLRWHMRWAVCHFALDSTCHPYVEQFTPGKRRDPLRIETEFDNMLNLRRDGLDPLKFLQPAISTRRNRMQRRSRSFTRRSGAGGAGLAQGMISVHRLLQASNPVKRWVVLTGMKVVGKYDMLHGLVADPQPNPKCVESGKRLEELYAQALPLAETLILEFGKAGHGPAPEQGADHTFRSFERAQKMRGTARQCREK